MKELLCIICSLMLLVGCSQGVSQAEYDAMAKELNALKSQIDAESAENSPQPEIPESSIEEKEEEKSGFNPDDVLKQLKVTEYQYENSIKTSWTILVIENTSKFDLDIEVSALFRDKSGALIGAKDTSEEAFEAGHTIAVAFSNDIAPDKVEYEILPKENDSKWYGCVLSALVSEVSTTDDKAVIAVTNDGTEIASFVQYTALFFKDGELVNHGTGYCIDDDSEIKPGKTIVKEAKAYTDFDSVQVYLTGRKA